MATQIVLPADASLSSSSMATINLPSEFKIHSQDGRLENLKSPTSTSFTTPAPPLGVLSSFTGTFAGTGFNLIFRPNSGPPTGTTFPNPVNPPPPTPPSENVLELNLTTETLSFSNPLGSIPNRGLEAQGDIFLNGVPYVQAINDVSNPATGKADGKPSGIHFEPGLWMHVPATKTDPVLGESLVRMASIPHGTTINAQCLAPTTSIEGPPTIPAVDITPFVIGTSKKIPFASQTASATDTARLPQDLSKFIAEGIITQAILTDPNTILRRANEGKKITKTTVFTVSTSPTVPELGGGTANIAFLQGATTGPTPGPNANAAQMSATFWIERVQHTLRIPIFKPGQAPLKIAPLKPCPDAVVPTFVVHPPHEITEPRTITVTSTQIQYSQIVFLNFAGLTWPHVSCATLVPIEELSVPSSVWE
ncbi:hypothetical protein BDV97DRAFT_49885 [Delphinella strobiligena]|nr:hypothetical protein BDV97DRAFT_49885 [Delphinella strobiligena]